jgi:hypothetical protein
MNRVVPFEIVSPMPNERTRKGSILVMRETAIAAFGEISGDRDYGGKESKGNESQDGDSHQRYGSTSHASEGSLKECKVLFVRTA